MYVTDTFFYFLKTIKLIQFRLPYLYFAIIAKKRKNQYFKVTLKT